MRDWSGRFAMCVRPGDNLEKNRCRWLDFYFPALSSPVIALTRDGKQRLVMSIIEPTIAGETVDCEQSFILIIIWRNTHARAKIASREEGVARRSAENNNLIRELKHKRP